MAITLLTESPESRKGKGRRSPLGFRKIIRGLRENPMGVEIDVPATIGVERCRKNVIGTLKYHQERYKVFPEGTKFNTSFDPLRGKLQIWLREEKCPQS